MQLELITKAMSCQKFCCLQHYNAGMKTMQAQYLLWNTLTLQITKRNHSTRKLTYLNNFLKFFYSSVQDKIGFKHSRKQMGIKEAYP